MPEYEVEELTAEGRDGGYHIGARVKSRVFELDCYFEEITQAQLEGIYRWLDRRNHGDLIFDERPFVRYEAFPSKRFPIALYDHDSAAGNLYSGTFTAYLTCCEPFGM